jgi:hypothetical protein
MTPQRQQQLQDIITRFKQGPYQDDRKARQKSSAPDQNAAAGGEKPQ